LFDHLADFRIELVARFFQLAIRKHDASIPPDAGDQIRHARLMLQRH